MIAEDYPNLIDWDKNEITEPPITTRLTRTDLQAVLSDATAAVSTLDLFHLPCQTQAVKMTVKEVTEVSSQVFGATARYGYIRARLQDRKQMPKFYTKHEFRL